jgi:hypothetical protein
MADLPDVLSGHWSTAEGREMAERYAAMSRADLSDAGRTDLELANALFLVDGPIGLQTAAKERMRWLSVQLALARAEIARRDAVACAVWGDQEDEHTEAINAAHPAHSKDYETFDRALAMVGKRHGKYELVALVNWLLGRAERAEVALGARSEAR